MTEAPTQSPAITACPACRHADDHESLLGCPAQTTTGPCGCDLITTYDTETITIASPGTVETAADTTDAPAISEPPHLTEAITPYAGTSGWSGSNASRDRATAADNDGTTKSRQNQALRALAQAGDEGLTWTELGHPRNWHHGTASGVLSNLHKEGAIARLSKKRNRCHIYVLPQYIKGRATQEQGRSTGRAPASNITDEESRAVATLRAGVYRRREIDLALALIDRLTA